MEIHSVSQDLALQNLKGNGGTFDNVFLKYTGENERGMTTNARYPSFSSDKYEGF
jgi:hypothetical protein